MPVYHSAYNSVDAPQYIFGCGVWPLRSKFSGPCPATEEADIIDEAISLFKANIMYRNYKPEGPGDLVNVYLFLFIHQCLKTLEKAKDKAEGQRMLNALSGEAPAVPGDSSFPISVIYPEAANGNEKKEMAKYLTQLRKETAARLPDLVFTDTSGPASKWWLCFAKRKFINKNL